MSSRMNNRQMQLKRLQADGHENGDAFMLYWYECVGESKPVQVPGTVRFDMIHTKRPCGHRERIWNSRDGVVPFGCLCPSCGSLMQHTAWSGDEYAPDHKLRRFQKYWTAMTEKRAREIARGMIDAARKHGYQPPNEDELTKTYMKASMKGGEPMLAVYTGDETPPLSVASLREGNWAHPDGGRIIGWHVPRTIAAEMGVDAFCLPRELADAVERLVKR